MLKVHVVDEATTASWTPMPTRALCNSTEACPLPGRLESVGMIPGALSRGHDGVGDLNMLRTSSKPMPTGARLRSTPAAHRGSR